MEVGNRVIYDQDGEILYQFGEMQGDVSPRKLVTSVDVVDLEYGQIDYGRYRIIGINVETKEPILETIPYIETEAERLRREKEELENQLLMAVDSQVGGIL